MIQRVRSAQVTVEGAVVGKIGRGLLTLLGVAPSDTSAELERLISKILKLRIFEDEQGKMNFSLLDIRGEHLIVSQFTLLGDASKGNRPSFVGAASPQIAEPLYEAALKLSAAAGVATAGGKFGAHMRVELENDGPVTLVLES